MAEILLARVTGRSDFVRPVVIKRVLRQYAGDRAYMAMFLDEARTMARIRHPNVVPIHELGDDGGEPFMVLEYVAGETLSSVVKRLTATGTSLDPTLVAHVVAEACAGLHAAHELTGPDGRAQNLVHRDVSPQNLFVDYDGHVRILDFGVARTDDKVARTEAGAVKGKFEYMSPEQILGRPLDRRSDVFSMGTVLYELVTGRRLWKRPSHARTVDAIVKEPIVPPSRVVQGLPADLDAIVAKSLAKDPAARYATALDMRRDLLAVSRALPSPVETLAERMRALFPDRIAEKDEMLRRAGSGEAIAQVPPTEVDEPVPVAAAPSGARSPLRAVLLFALVTAGVVFVVAATRGREAGPPPSSPSSAPPPPTVTSAEPAPPIEPSPLVLVHVESQPTGARVSVDGKDSGETPLDLRLPRGATSVRLDLHKKGYESATQTVVPDADQKLLLALARPPQGRPAPPPPRPSTTASAPGFRRFD